MLPVENALPGLDGPSAARVRPVLAWLRERRVRTAGTHGAEGAPKLSLLRQFLTRELPRRWRVDDREQHEVAWALGDLFEHAGLPDHAALCRSVAVHETLAVWQWIGSFPEVPADFWHSALDALGTRTQVPPRAALSLSSAHALLESVGSGLTLTSSGQLPLATVLALDDRFRWTEEFPWMRAGEEADIAPLRFLHGHLVAQRLLAQDGDRLTRTALGVECAGDTGRLWRTVVDPAPRWSQEFDRDVLGTMAASVLRSADFTVGRVGEELTHVLAAKWRPAAHGSVFDGASAVVQGWYQVGVPLGWWDTGRGPADRRPNLFGRAAAVAVFRAVASPPLR